MFITFEGLDSSGKSTQAVLLANRLKREDRPCLLLREPGGTAISEKVRTILLDRSHAAMTQKAELFLFCAARTQLVAEIIKPALKNGIIVICDRFTDSTTAYQGYGRGLGLDDVTALNKIAIDGTTPDLTLLLDVELDEIARRRRQAGLSDDRMESSGNRFFEKVRQGYRAIAANEPGRVVVIDGMQPVEHIQRVIWREVSKRFSPVAR